MLKSSAEWVSRFAAWLDEARAHPHIKEPTAMTLATVGPGGAPAARIVLLKSFDERGFCFFTNNQSRKGVELLTNSQAALCFYWMPLARQVRVEGIASPVSEEEANTYFASRSRESRIGAWASEQSRVVEEEGLLEKRYAEQAARFAGKEVARPPHWSGWRVSPEVVEFWAEGPHRLHRRERLKREAGGWIEDILYP